MAFFPIQTNYKITSNFGYRGIIDGVTTDAYHHGIDISVPSGTSVYAANNGTVTESSYNDVLGNYIKILGNDGITTLYAHLNTRYVTVGSSVNQGSIIASSGNTGASTGSHLHFAVQSNGKFIDPLAWFNSSDSTNGENNSINTSTKELNINAENISKAVIIAALFLFILNKK